MDRPSVDGVWPWTLKARTDSRVSQAFAASLFVNTSLSGSNFNIDPIASGSH